MAGGHGRRETSAAMTPPASDGRPELPQAGTVGAAERARRRAVPQPPGEIGGPAGPEPTRYGDWERGGRCIDF